MNTHRNMFHYVRSGLDYVWLVNGFTRLQTPQGHATRIHDLEGLHRAIAERIISAPARLRGQEVRFLRSMLDVSQDGLGRVLGQTRASVARWEGNRDKPIPGASDRALRLFYAAHAEGGDAAKRLSDLLMELDEIQHGDREECFADDADGWKAAA